MLKKFYLENYRNLDFECPVCFENITGIYGICGAGKSNFCRALGDIAREQAVYNLNSDKAILFSYVFRYGEEDVELLYRRNKEGVIDSACFFAAQSKTESISVLNSRNVQMQLLDIRKNMLENGSSHAICLLNQLIEEIGDMRIFMFEEHKGWGCPDPPEDVSVNRGNAQYSPDDFGKASLIIYDDLDVRMDAAEHLLEKNRFSHSPVVYTTRRPELIEKWCEKVQDCILIHEGKVVNAKTACKKDLRTLKQLICFLKAQSVP